MAQNLLKLFIGVILFSLIFSETYSINYQSYNPTNTRNKNVAYTIFVPGKKLPDGTQEMAKIYEIPKQSEEFYLPNSIHIKTKSTIDISGDGKTFYSSVLMSLLKNYNVTKINAPFRNQGDMALTNYDEGLTRIFEVFYSYPIDPYELCKEMMKNPEIEYATPVFKRFTNDFYPNDPDSSKQWYINNLQMKKAWDISKGDKSVKIAIIDSGVDWEHPDLQANIWTNPGEDGTDSEGKDKRTNGKDDDGNGKIDDWHGWDMIGNINQNELFSGQYKEDNNPKNVSGFHGTHVAGCASAVTNNKIGISGVGFNCSLIPVKCAPDASTSGIFRAYEAITYAANLGADIINCSWGGPGFSPVEQEVITAAYKKGCVIVVAAGNDNQFNIDDGGQFPAGYDNVLCVGSTASNNRVSSFSNIGISVTVYSPGSTIYSTMPNNSYSNQNGTSMASPITSGIAGLIKSLHKDWTPKQIIHQIRSTSDNVVTTDSTKRHIFYGRANAYKALDYNRGKGNEIPGLEISEAKFVTGDALTDYDSKLMSMKVTNYLSNANNVKITISSIDNILSITGGSIELGSIGNLQTKPFTMMVQLQKSNPWYRGWAKLLVTFTSGTYKDFQLLKVPIQLESKNSYSQVFAVPDYYMPVWYDAISSGENLLWGVGQGGFLGTQGGFLRYYNGQITNRSLGQPAFAIYAFNESKAIVGTSTSNGTVSNVMITSNGGTNWSTIGVSQITGFINKIYFFDENNGVFTGDPKNGKWGIAKTSDGGNNWVQIQNVTLPLPNETCFNTANFWNGDLGAFGTTHSRVFITTNRGENWKVSTISGAGAIYYLAFKDELNGLAVYNQLGDTTSRVVASTSNGGATWITNRYRFQSGSMPVGFFNIKSSKGLYVVCSGGQVYTTTDNGANWDAVLSQYHGTVQLGTGYAYRPNRARAWNLSESAGYLDFVFDPLNIKKEVQLVTSANEDFDTVKVGSSKSKTVSIKNTGNIELNFKDFRFRAGENTDSNEFKIFGATPSLINPDEVINIRVRFVPETPGTKESDFIMDFEDETIQDLVVKLKGIAVEEPSSVFSEHRGNNIINIFPNPAREYLEIRILNRGMKSFAQNDEIKIYNILGECVISSMIEDSFSLQRIDITYLTAGIYFIRFGNSVESFIKI